MTHTHWLIILIAFPMLLVSWKKPSAKQAQVNSSVCAPADTLKLNDLIFSDFISPNGDGYNDHFVIINVENYPGNSIQIFNRWGEVVYQAQPYINEWAGNNNRGGAMINNTLTDGVYYFEFYDGIGNNASGKITVKR